MSHSLYWLQLAQFRIIWWLKYILIMQVRLRDHGLLDFDGQQLRRQPPFDTTWHQVLMADIWTLLNLVPKNGWTYLLCCTIAWLLCFEVTHVHMLRFLPFRCSENLYGLLSSFFLCTFSLDLSFFFSACLIVCQIAPWRERDRVCSFWKP
jgi:hypothetical protein